MDKALTDYTEKKQRKAFFGIKMGYFIEIKDYPLLFFLMRINNGFMKGNFIEKMHQPLSMSMVVNFGG